MFTVGERTGNRPSLPSGTMTFPFFATPYPDAKASGPILGAEQRAISA